jgi:predicted HTH domain antitoxin
MHGKSWSVEEGAVTKTRVVPLRIPENLDELAALSAQTQHTDKATALRQWMHEGAARYVIGLVAEGRVSIGRGAELLDLTVYDMLRLAETHGIELGASEAQRLQSRALAIELAAENPPKPGPLAPEAGR